MCLIVDTNALPAVLNKNNKEHHQFEPIHNWIFNGNGKLVYGGSKIKIEYGKLEKYLKILSNLDKIRKVIRLNDIEVDNKQKELEKIEGSSSFNDSHIVAMVFVSKIRIVCTNDTKSLKYLQDARFYSRGVKAPKIYSKAEHKHLINKTNCKPCWKLMNID